MTWDDEDRGCQRLSLSLLTQGEANFTATGFRTNKPAKDGSKDGFKRLEQNEANVTPPSQTDAPYHRRLMTH